MNSPAAANDLFGVWLMAVGLDHYFLNGRPLCGSAAEQAEKRLADRNRNVNVQHRCERCHKLNLERWLRGGK